MKILKPFAAVLSLTLCLYACTLVENLPEIIESEISDSGIDGDVSCSTSSDDKGVKTQTLSYKSWIRVTGQTKADYENVITVNLKGELPDFSQEAGIEMIVETLHPRWTYTSESSRKEGERKEGFVTIIDSVKVITVHHFNFDFSYKLLYEVPIYDDGVTRKIMPYYRVENYVDRGYTLKQEDSIVKDGVAYARNIYKHTLEVTFNGKVYLLHAYVTLLRELGSANQPYIVRSVIEDEGTTVFSDHLLVSILVKTTWSTGEVRTNARGVELCQVVVPDYVGLRVNDSKDKIKFISSELVREDSYLLGQPENNVSIVRYVKDIKLHFTLIGDLDLEIYGDEAYYDDGVLYHYFSSGNAVGNIEFDGVTWEMKNSGIDEGKYFEYYIMTCALKIQFGTRIVRKEIEYEVVCFPPVS